MTVPSQLHAAWKHRIVADQASVDDTTAQLLAARHECQLAEDALALAAAKVEHLKAEVRLLEQRQSAATEQLARSRAASLRIAASNLPDDVLRCIFTCCAALPDAQWTQLGHGSFNRERTTLPFSLAAVCTRWRRVALDYGGLWTYISLPSIFASEGAARRRSCHHGRIERLLSRSQLFPLDVLLNLGVVDFNSPNESKWIRSIFASISYHSDRWRRVEIDFPHACGRDIAGAFKGPLPMLKQLLLLGPYSEAWVNMDDENSYFLPHAPMLEALDLCRTGFDISPVHGGFPSLHSITVTNDMSAESLRRLLELSRTTLQVLDMNVQFNEASPLSLTLPNLRTLVLHLELFFVTAQRTVNLNAPRLSALTLRSADIMFDDALSVLLEHVSATVTSLTLYEDVCMDFIDTFARLRNLSHIVFGTRDYGCQVDDQFFVALSKQVPTVWPRLQSIVLHDGKITPPHGDGIIQLVAVRNASPNNASLLSGTETDVSERPCRIREVNLPDDTPRWMIAEINRLLVTTS
ncbi:hypothetical protein EXIGLDRAFT_733302 [Exidia glandulosa HHB12029]|uniref:Uncharacterized protein n=1 Tax=Exidia glandulosa HHB12029 TaxID=1314781 RepID=A0A165KIB2_EXIGL|nr:hypothetical protein EXIGLDRAFT_733302 [Exidia glandulosa HHB12029]